MKILFSLIAFFSLFLVSVSAKADGCYICQSGSYVRYAGEDTKAKRLDASMCGCRIVGTTNKCDVPGIKIMCTVFADQPASPNKKVVMK